MNGSSEVNPIDKRTIVCSEDVLQKGAQQQLLPKENHGNLL